MHRRSSYYIYVTCIHILIATPFVWLMIGLLPFIAKKL